MTPRQRVLATLEGKPVDRVASHFRAEPEGYEKLQAHLNLPDAEAVRASRFSNTCCGEHCRT